MLWWDPHWALRQLQRMIPSPKDVIPHSGRAPVGNPGPCCGCCPSCRMFIRIEASGRRGASRCPNCGRLVGSLDALGEDRFSGADEWSKDFFD